MKTLKVMSFMDGGDLMRFVNANNIKKDDIVSIFLDTIYYMLFYYS